MSQTQKTLFENEIQCLIAKAEQARQNAYAPYSGFRVGAALCTSEGRIYTGVNVENASYPVGICAERTAFAAAVASGERHFDAIAIVGGKDGESADFCYPCGMCRQFMAELCGEDFLVIAAGAEGSYRIFQLSELLPSGFIL